MERTDSEQARFYLLITYTHTQDIGIGTRTYSIVKGREKFVVWKSGVLEMGVRQTPSKAQGKGVGFVDFETFGLENEDGI